MQIQRLEENKLVEAYGVLCQFMPKQKDRQGAYPTFVRIREKEKTTAHCHFEEEIFYIISGTGKLQIDGEVQAVTSGDLIRIPSFSLHMLTNTENRNLDYLSVYSEDYTINSLPKQIVITAAPPTPNGPLHLGHISGPYLAADILAKYYRLRRVQVTAVTGTDDHQNYVYEKAKSEGVDVNTFKNQTKLRILNCFSTMNIKFDELTSPSTDPNYKSKVRDFFDKAKNQNVIDRTTVQFPFCRECNEYIVDGLANGTCPSCGSPSSGACENCGMVTAPFELPNIRCSRGHSPELITSEVYLFNLSKYIHLISNDLKNLNLTAHQRQLAEKVLLSKNLNVLVTCPSNSKFGIEADNDQIIHPWFEMASDYEKYSLQNATWLNAFGFDNSFYYLFFIPALTKALNPRSRMASKLINNEFLLLNGKKFSTSRNHAIWADNHKFNTEMLRLFLCLNRPSSRKSNFSESEFEQLSSDMESKLKLLQQIVDNISLNLRRDDTHLEESFQKCIIECNRFTKEIESALSAENLNFRQAARLLINFLDYILYFDGGLLETKLLINSFLLALQPFMPLTANNYLNDLKIQKRNWVSDWSSEYAVI